MRRPGGRPVTAVPPPWLVEVVRPAPAALPWALLIRSALAVCAPLAFGLALGKQVPGLLGALGGLLAAVVDRGGTYPARLRWVAVAGVSGALQRGLGTVAGAVLGAIILIVIPPGPLLLLPCAVFAGVLPYSGNRNWGLFSTFLTPLVVILIELARSPAGRVRAGTR